VQNARSSIDQGELTRIAPVVPFCLLRDHLVSVLGNPQQVSEDDVIGSMGSVSSGFVSGHYAYIGGGHPWAATELRVLDISDPFRPVRVGSHLIHGSAKDIVVSGGHAFISDGAGLKVFDISHPANPQSVGHLPAGEEWVISAIAASEDYAFVGDGGDFEVIDVSDPTNPQRIGGLEESISAYDMEVSGDYAYLPGRWSEVDGCPSNVV